MQRPLVSIVVNNFNYGRFLARAVESALTQTYENVEVIVVDDGSTDDSRSILQSFKDRARILLKENSGQAGAFNVGIQAARGVYTLLLDSDDYLLPEAVATCVEKFPLGYSRVYYRLQTVDSSGAVLNAGGDVGHFREFEGDVFKAIERGEPPFFSVPTSGNFFATDKLKAVLPIPEDEYRICADSFLLVKSSLAGGVKSIDQVLGAYRVHTGNNFAFAAFRYSDTKKLRTQIDNFYRTRSLIREGCKTAGFDHRFEPEEADSFVTQCLCIGYKLRVQSKYLEQWDLPSLGGLVWRFFRTGRDSRMKRFTLAVYLALVLLLPRAAAQSLIRGMDRVIQLKAARRASRSARETRAHTGAFES